MVPLAAPRLKSLGPGMEALHGKSWAAQRLCSMAGGSGPKKRIDF